MYFAIAQPKEAFTGDRGQILQRWFANTIWLQGIDRSIKYLPMAYGVAAHVLVPIGWQNP
jgi:hypothetical protein